MKIRLERDVMAEAVAWAARSLPTRPSAPILTGLPFGHVPTKVSLPVGARLQLAVQGRQAFVGW